jgi:hypothetical protein
MIEPWQKSREGANGDMRDRRCSPRRILTPHWVQPCGRCPADVDDWMVADEPSLARLRAESDERASEDLRVGFAHAFTLRDQDDVEESLQAKGSDDGLLNGGCPVGNHTEPHPPAPECFECLQNLGKEAGVGCVATPELFEEPIARGCRQIELCRDLVIDDRLIAVAVCVQEENASDIDGGRHMSQFVGETVTLFRDERLNGGGAVDERSVEIEEDGVNHDCVWLPNA